MATTNGKVAHGKVVQVLGGVVDCEFPEVQLPELYDAIEVPRQGQAPLDPGSGEEPGQQLGPLCGHGHHRRPAPRHRCAWAPAPPIQVPVGPATLGRIFNVLGQPVDNAGPVDTDLRSAHSPPGTAVRGPGDQRAGFRDRPQGH